MRYYLTRIPLALWLLVLLACIVQPPEEGDRDLVLKIGQLQPYGLSLPRDFMTFESLKREQWIDGQVTVEYEFEAPEELGLPYLYSFAELHHPSNAEACASLSAGDFAMRLSGVEISERNDLFRFGDKSRFVLLVEEGEPYGNYFAMCRGNSAFMVLLNGFYFDDGDIWGELLRPTLDAIDTMN